MILTPGTNFASYDFSLPTHQGGEFHFAHRAAQGPTIVIFYRGHWCPYCARYLGKKIQPNLERLTADNGVVVAISPEPVRTSADFAVRCGITFPLLSDIDGYVIGKFGVKNGFSSATASLPHPAVIVFDSDLRVRFRSVDRNYKKRTTVRAIFSALDALKQSSL